MFDTEFFPTPSHVAKHMLHSLKLVPDDAFDRTADPVAHEFNVSTNVIYCVVRRLTYNHL